MSAIIILQIIAVRIPYGSEFGNGSELPIHNAVKKLMTAIIGAKIIFKIVFHFNATKAQIKFIKLKPIGNVI
ncbi:hypothetical protein OX284_005695 [Flavobacterium sp. SUN046]|jgi:hypothetical protein|uniref:hypothetical protein n=1 Tax=Flavobacterium sp. SUN046 TaxID=3002440 RepID=UPI002DC0593C|nr:hypothetical protein [Flavobacterium sp. SUN046]MEC4048911.1 hypothetical protein [Flavobacterium sp. SUN046]